MKDNLYIPQSRGYSLESISDKYRNDSKAYDSFNINSIFNKMSDIDKLQNSIYALLADISILLVDYRVEHKLTQSQLANALGISKEKLKKMENGNM